MKRSRFSEEQVIAILKEHEVGAKTVDISRRHGISDATFYKWKAKYGGMEVSEAKRLKALEDENARLKKLLAEAMLDNAVLKDLASKNGSARWRPPQPLFRYEPTMPDDGALRQRLRELAAGRRRFGYRRLGYLLAREGIAPNHKKLLRIYREEGLRGRRRGGRKHALGTRRPMVLPDGPNQRWSLDFVSDSLICGRRFRILCVVDDYTREGLALVADTSLSGARVARALTRLRGTPHTVVSDTEQTD